MMLDIFEIRRLFLEESFEHFRHDVGSGWRG